jgi:hypothetical protein
MGLPGNETNFFGPFFGILNHRRPVIRTDCDGGCDYPSRSKIATVKPMTFTATSSLPRPKSDCYVGCDAAVKGASVVVVVLLEAIYNFVVDDFSI